MPLSNKYGMRDFTDPITNTVNMLESDQPLPDDDTRSRSGGLKPNRESDLAQIKVYMQLRQNGQISDKAWARLIQRNPASASLFSSIGPTPEVLAEKRRQEILGQYFAPERQAVPFQTTEEQEFGLPQLQGNIAQEAAPAKEDTENAVRAMLQSGDIEGAKSLLGVTSPRSGSKARPFQIQTVDKSGNPITVILDPETRGPLAEYPMVPKALASQDIEKLSSAASVSDTFT